MPPGGCAVVIQNFQLIHLARSIQPATLLFDYIDDAFGFTAMPAYVRDLWKETVTSSNLVTVTAAKLQQQIGGVRSGAVHIVRNGVEYERFAGDTSPRPDDLPSGDRPIVGYVGSVYPWFDFDLVAATAAKMRETNFVIIGPGHPDVAGRIDELRRHPNIHILGPRPYDRVPAYVRHFSAGIIPFRRNTLTESVNPVKLYEYSAAGIPTVTTCFADDLDEFRDIVHLARSEQEFMEKLSHALAESRAPDAILLRQLFGRQNDWNARITAILSLLASDPAPPSL
jgi:glycosyltransferase involved in cell wall biosynthesis